MFGPEEEAEESGRINDPVLEHEGADHIWVKLGGQVGGV